MAENNVGEFSFSIASSDIVRRRSFGRYEVIETVRGIMYKSWLGYHVWCDRFTVGPDGKAVPKGLFAWLQGLLDYAGDLDRNGDGDSSVDGVSRKELLDTMSIMTEANLSYPITAFVDEDRAMRFAGEYMEWLIGQARDLQSAMEGGASEDDGGAADKELMADALVTDVMRKDLEEFANRDV